MKSRVLIVEDNLINILAVTVFLKEKYTVDFAKDGTEAIKLATENDFDIILMDINLGAEPDGFIVTKEIKKLRKYKTIPVIAVTAYPFESIEEKYIDSGFSHYLAKPFSRIELINVLNQYSK